MPTNFAGVGARDGGGPRGEQEKSLRQQNYKLEEGEGMVVTNNLTPIMYNTYTYLYMHVHVVEILHLLPESLEWDARRTDLHQVIMTHACRSELIYFE